MVRTDNLDSYIFFLCWCSWNAKFVDILEFARPYNWQLDVYMYMLQCTSSMLYAWMDILDHICTPFFIRSFVLKIAFG
jgi:hypothetical protein